MCPQGGAAILRETGLMVDGGVPVYNLSVLPSLCKCRSIYKPPLVSGRRDRTLVKSLQKRESFLMLTNTGQCKLKICLSHVAHLILNKMAAHLVLFHSLLSSAFVFVVLTLVIKALSQCLTEKKPYQK